MNLIQLNLLWIVIILFRLIWHQREFRLVLNQSEKCNYNPDLVQQDSYIDLSLRWESFLLESLIRNKKTLDEIPVA